MVQTFTNNSNWWQLALFKTADTCVRNSNFWCIFTRMPGCGACPQTEGKYIQRIS